MHVNHVQIVSSETEPLSGWHQVGDWVDTYGGTGTVRFRTDRYTGKVVMHCHLLQHEDEGCMAVSEIVRDIGEEWGYCTLCKTWRAQTDAPQDFFFSRIIAYP